MKDLKEYGADLEKDYNDTKSKLISLEAKIIKRYKFMVKKTSFSSEGRKKKLIKLANDIPGDRVAHFRNLLSYIKAAELLYVSKSKQTEMKF